MGRLLAPKATAGRGKLPSPGNVSTPFMKVDDIKKKGTTTLTLTGARGEVLHSEYGEQIAVNATLNGDQFTLAVKLSSGNYNRLFAKFGDDPDRWRGKVEVQRATFKGKEYIQVV